MIFKKVLMLLHSFMLLSIQKCKEQLVKEKNVSHISHCYCVSLDIVTQLKAAKYGFVAVPSAKEVAWNELVKL